MGMQANFLAKMQSYLPTAVRALAPSHDRNALITRQEIAEVWKMPLRTAYSKIETGNLSGPETLALMRELASRGDLTLFNAVLPEGLAVIAHKCICQPDGSLSEEYEEAVVAMGEIGRDFNNGDKKGAMRVLPRLKEAVVKIEKELIA